MENKERVLRLLGILLHLIRGVFFVGALAILVYRKELIMPQTLIIGTSAVTLLLLLPVLAIPKTRFREKASVFLEVIIIGVMLWVANTFEPALWLPLLFLVIYNFYNFIVGIVEHFKNI